MNTTYEIQKYIWTVINRIQDSIKIEDYKYKILGLIFLRYLSDSFEEARTKLLTSTNGKADPEDLFEYIGSGAVYLPPNARWNYLKGNSKNPEIGFLVDKAREELQNYKPGWKGCLPDGYADKDIDPKQIGELIEIISDIHSTGNHKDIWIGLFEYIVGRFPDFAGKDTGEFYSPRSVIQLMVRTLAPENGNIYDPCCGSGTMLIEANEYINEHSPNTASARLYGQEQSSDSIKRTTMYLAMRGIDTTICIGDTFAEDKLPGVEADYILANPPFNISWPSEEFRHDKRWMYGVPSDRNANYVWIQHCLSKLSPDGTAAIILPNGTLNSKSKIERDIRRKMIEAGNIACIIALPSHLFYTTAIPVSIWIITNSKPGRDILFINVPELEQSRTKHVREFTSHDITHISDIYHKWQADKEYEDIPGLCKSTPISEVFANSYSLVPSLYVDDIEETKDTFLFEEKMSFLTKELSKQEKSARNNVQVNRTLNEIVNTVFNEWFIHFNSPYISEKRKNSALGLIPEDWEVMPLEMFCKLQMGYSFKNKDYNKEGTVGIIKIKNIRENFVDISATDFVDKLTVESIDKKYKVESNSLLIAMSGSDAGKVALVPPLDKNKELWLNQRVGMFKEEIPFGNFYLYLLLSTNTYQTILRKSAIGTAQPNISVADMNQMRVIIPPAYLIKQFGQEMYPMFEKIRANNAKNMKLENIQKSLFD